MTMPNTDHSGRPTLIEGEPHRRARGALHVGVLALQGDFAEHLEVLATLGVEASEVRTLAQLEQIDALIIPGGESTTIARLLLIFDLMEPLRQAIEDGLPVWGTCAGAILLANDVPGLDRPPLGVMDIGIERNAFGRQVDSFNRELAIAGIEGPPTLGVFIRAPVIITTGEGVEVLSTLPDGRIVAAREGNMLATAFHPELTGDTRLHALFLDLIEEQRNGATEPQSEAEAAGGK
jgi:5'-phosphate synthase pdxT subunit